jgi:hypothetical protein
MQKPFMLLALLEICCFEFTAQAYAQGYDRDKLIEEIKKTMEATDLVGGEVVIENATTGETHVFPLPPAQSPTAFITAAQQCGLPQKPPVIYVQPAGGFEYRWCDGPSANAYLDVWYYSNGTLRFRTSYTVYCTSSMPDPVRAIACP